MKKEKFSRLDPAEFLETEEEMRLYLQITLEENGIKSFQRALGTVARARGMNELAEKTGLGRQNLYKALTEEANPKIDTINKVVEALGLKLTVSA